MLTIISGIKGIQKLKMDEKDFQNLQDSKVVGIYGPNGVGKSSFKKAIINAKDDINWNTKPEDVKIRNSLIIRNYGIFDENLVESIKGNVEEISFLGNKVKNLFELLTQREEKLPNDFKNIFNLNFFKSNNNDFEFYYQKIQELKELLITAKELKTSTNFTYDKPQIIMIQSIYLEFITTYNALAEGLFQGNIYRDKSTNIHSYNGMTWSTHNNEIAHSLDVFSTNDYDDKIIVILENHLDEILEILSGFFTIKNNFGYINEDNFLEKQFSKLINIQNNDNFVFSNEIKSLGLQISEFISRFQNNQDKINNFKNIWSKILKNVISSREYANKLLSLYQLGYEIKLSANTISDQKTKKTNLELLHLKSQKTLNQNEIFLKVSYGEMNIIAFCLFVSSLMQRKSNKNYQLIFDDPISSYDLNKINITISIIQKILHQDNMLEKVYIFSHEKHFIKEIKKYFQNCKTKCENNINCFECNDKKNYFFLEKNDNVHFLKPTNLESDLETYLLLKDSKVKRTQYIAIRVLINSIKEIVQGVLKKEKNKEKINKITNSFIQTLFPNKKYTTQKITDFIKDPKINIKMQKERFSKDELYAFRDNYAKKFQDWLEKFNKTLSLEKIIEKDSSDFILFRSLVYIRVLNRIIHGESNIHNIDLSRSAEMADILYSNQNDLIETMKKAYIIYENYEKSQKNF